jgi:hypothetical protein
MITWETMENILLVKFPKSMIPGRGARLAIYGCGIWIGFNEYFAAVL